VSAFDTWVCRGRGRPTATVGVMRTRPAAVVTAALVSMLALAGVAEAKPRCFQGKATITGTSGADRIRGTGGNDVIFALGGDDRVRLRGGNDRVCLGAGDDGATTAGGGDSVEGNGGRDRIRLGGEGAPPFDDLDDIVQAGAGNDRVDARGANSDDLVSGDEGSDLLLGGGRLHGNEGNDTLEVLSVTGSFGQDFSAGKGNDRIEIDGDAAGAYAGPGDDVVLGSPSGDQLHGNAGDDLVRGRAGNDALYGDDFPETGDDRLFGGAGDDFIRGGPGNDFCDRGPETNPGGATIFECEEGPG
jgi:Ca2+-binding RTX toxin-like protein